MSGLLTCQTDGHVHHPLHGNLHTLPWQPALSSSPYNTNRLIERERERERGEREREREMHMIFAKLYLFYELLIRMNLYE